MKTVLLCLTLSLSLGKDMPFSVHVRNIQQLALEMYKVTKGHAPTAVSSSFLQYSNNGHTRLQSDFSVPQVNKVYFGRNSIRYLVPLMWNSIPTANPWSKIGNHQTALSVLCKDYIHVKWTKSLKFWTLKNFLVKECSSKLQGDFSVQFQGFVLKRFQNGNKNLINL